MSAATFWSSVSIDCDGTERGVSSCGTRPRGPAKGLLQRRPLSNLPSECQIACYQGLCCSFKGPSFVPLQCPAAVPPVMEPGQGLLPSQQHRGPAPGSPATACPIATARGSCPALATWWRHLSCRHRKQSQRTGTQGPGVAVVLPVCLHWQVGGAGFQTPPSPSPLPSVSLSLHPDEGPGSPAGQVGREDSSWVGGSQTPMQLVWCGGGVTSPPRVQPAGGLCRQVSWIWCAGRLTFPGL